MADITGNINSSDISIYPLSDRRLDTSNGDISKYGYLDRLNLEQNKIKQYNVVVDNKI